MFAESVDHFLFRRESRLTKQKRKEILIEVKIFNKYPVLISSFNCFVRLETNALSLPFLRSWNWRKFFIFVSMIFL